MMDQLYCEPCKTLCKQTAAEQWCMDCEERLCNDCSKIHKVQKMSNKHHLILLKEKQNHLNTQMDCTIHDKAFEFFCVDHNILCCNECVALSHQMCQNVQALDSAAMNAKDSEAFVDLRQHIKHILRELTRLLENRHSNIIDLETKAGTIKEEIVIMKQNMIDRLNKLEQSLLSQLHKEKETQISVIQTQVQEIEQLISETESKNETFELIQQHGSDKEAFLKTQTSQQEEIQNIESKVVKVFDSSSIALSLRFISCKDTHSMSFGSIEKIQGDYGDLYSSYKHSQFRIPIRNHSSCEIFTYKNYMQTVENMIITGMAVTSSNQLLVCDVKNVALHAYDQNETFLRSVDLANKPWDVATIPKTTEAVVMVSLGFCKSALQFVDVFSWMLQNKVVVPEGSDLNGITVTNDHILVGSKNEVHVFSHRGCYVKSIKLNTEGQIWYLTATLDGTIAFTCLHNDTVFGVNNDGCAVFTYKSEDMITPRKIVCDDISNLYVVAEDTQNIHKLTPDGKQVKIILSHENFLVNPCALCFDKTYSKLYVSSDDGERLVVFKVFGIK